MENNMEMNGKYQIISRISSGTGFNTVLGYNEKAMEGYEYVTWIENSRGFDSGHYFGSKKEAQIDFINRGARGLGIDLDHVYYEKQAIETIENALSELFSKKDVESLLKNKQFMGIAYDKYLSFDDSDPTVVELMRDLNPSDYLEKTKTVNLDDYELEM